MRLISLSMQNFRQHAASRISFAPGLTGIIGANGSGKSTILEGFAFALYGQPAARGKKESIKFLRAQPRASVRVELVFELNGHRYRVVRGLTTAECYLDDAETPIANTLTGVTDMLQRTLGMSREEFFCTYFTGQKELAMMATMSPTERAKFLSRVLGYDRIGDAQESVRERRRTLIAELSGLRGGMQDSDVVAQAVRDASDRLTVAQAAAAKWDAERARAHGVVQTLEPSWADAQLRHEATLRLKLDVQLAAQQEVMHQRDIDRLTAAITELNNAAHEAAALRVAVVDLPALRDQVREMDVQATAHATRQNLLGVQQTVQQTLVRANVRLAELATLTDATGVTASAIEQLRVSVADAESRSNVARDAWTAKLADARSELQSLRDQHEKATAQRAKLTALGEESPCATCGQRMGARFATVVQELTDTIASLTEKGLAAKALVATLSATPAEVTVAQSERATLLASLQDAERALANANATASERARVTAEIAAADERLATIQQSLGELTATYDADAHRVLRARVEGLTQQESTLRAINDRVTRGEALRVELATAEIALNAARQSQAQLLARLGTEGIDPDAFAAQRLAFQTATLEATSADTARNNALSEVSRAEESLGHHTAAQARLAGLRERVATMEHERFVLDETDRGYTDLRTTLNASLRPELAEIASELLDTLTDGRYTQADIDETYTLTVMEDGLAKPVISGGEEDLCNLILRLAISQMIAQRAGHVFSLLILDEVFGSLDDARRGNVMELLRRLTDRFAQVIIITHIGQVRDGLDNVLQVRFDADTGTSMIVADDLDDVGASLQAAA